jgi:hypothetical protein
MLEERRVLSTLTVTSNLDGNYFGMLRGEIAAAQPGDTIVFDPSLNGQTISLAGSQLEINKNLTIQGPGAGLLAISGQGYMGSRVFQVDAGTNVTISGLTIEDGSGDRYNNQFNGPTDGWNTDSYDGYGGGILNLGTLTLSGSNVTNNQVGFLLGNALGSNFGGGGIFNEGTMTLTGSTVTGNTVPTFYRSDGTTVLYPSKGGGIFNDTQGNLTITSSTVTNNTAPDGLDICSLGSITISKDSTIGSKVSKK